MNSEQNEFLNKTCVVTGAGGALGGAVAEAVARKGMRTVVLDIDAAAADKRVARIEEAGGKALSCVCSVLDEGALENALATIEGKFGSPDYLINASGGNSP